MSEIDSEAITKALKNLINKRNYIPNIDEITEFNDFGRIKWFKNDEFGIVDTVHSDEVFIHKKNNIFGSAREGNYVIICDIRASRTRKNEGFNCICFETSEVICKKLLEKWISKGNNYYNIEIKWLIQNCSSDIIEQVINRNKKKWFTNYEFIEDLKCTASKKGEYYISIVCNLIYELWSSSINLEYDDNLKWLLNHCNGDIIIKIIDFDRNKWKNNQDFNKQLQNLKYDKDNSLLLNFLSDYFFELWGEEVGNHISDNLKWLIYYGNSKTIEKVINSKKDSWLNNNQFIDLLKINRLRLYKMNPTFDIVYEFILESWKLNITEKYDDITSWLITNAENKNILIEKIIKYNYSWIYDTCFTNDYFNLNTRIEISKYLLVINASKTYNNLEFNNEIGWVIENCNDSTLESLLKYESLYDDQRFIKAIKLVKDEYDSKIISNFFLEIWIRKGEFEYNSDIEWFFYRCSASDLNHFLFNHFDYLQKDIRFLELALRVKHVEFNHFYSSEIIEEDITGIKKAIETTKFNLVQEYIYKVWLSSPDYQINNCLIWLIENSDVKLIINIIDLNKSNWLKNEKFLDLLCKTVNNEIYLEGRSYEYAESICELSSNEKIVKIGDFVFEYCLNCLNLKNNHIISWLFRHSTIERIKLFIVKKLQYSNNTVDSIYNSFFPSNNIKYFEKNISSDWSDDFKEKYLNKIKEKFIELFESEINTSIQNIRKEKLEIKKIHSATDLANFTFCPASYIINQLNEVPSFKEQESILIGINEHEKQRLLSLLDIDKVDNFRKRKAQDNTLQNFYRKIFNSKCVSNGHSGLKPTIYYSKKGNLSGIPDYIFKENNGYFAVEEKYTIKKFDDLTDIYENHKIQALAYLYGLNDFEFNSVYVIYWFIEKNQLGEHVVSDYKLFTLTKSIENKSKIIDCFNKIESLQKRVSINFDVNKINYRKCIKCNYFPFCEYKKGKNNTLQLSTI
jgi:hypothetical protein